MLVVPRGSNNTKISTRIIFFLHAVESLLYLMFLANQQTVLTALCYSTTRLVEIFDLI